MNHFLITPQKNQKQTHRSSIVLQPAALFECPAVATILLSICPNANQLWSSNALHPSHTVLTILWSRTWKVNPNKSKRPVTDARKRWIPDTRRRWYASQSVHKEMQKQRRPEHNRWRKRTIQQSQESDMVTSGYVRERNYILRSNSEEV